MINQLVNFLQKPRVIFVASLILWAFTLYNDSIQGKRSSAPYPVVMVLTIFSHLLVLWLIDHHDERWQFYVGYFTLLLFFCIGFGGVFFGL